MAEEKSAYQTKVEDLAGMHGLDVKQASDEAMESVDAGRKLKTDLSQLEDGELAEQVEEHDEIEPPDGKDKEGEKKVVKEKVEEEEPELDENGEPVAKPKRSWEERYRLEKAARRKLEVRLGRLERSMADSFVGGRAPTPPVEDKPKPKVEEMFDDEDADLPLTKKEAAKLMQRLIKEATETVQSTTQRQAQASKEAEEYAKRASESEKAAKGRWEDYDDAVDTIIKPRLNPKSRYFDPALAQTLFRSKDPARLAYILAKEELGEEVSLNPSSDDGGESGDEDEGSSGEGRVAEAIERRLKLEKTRTFGSQKAGSGKPGGKKAPKKPSTSLFSRLVGASDEQLRAFEDKYGAD
jgi:hypothetical protein